MGKIEDDNLKKLSSKTIAMNFVKKNKGEWDHQKWLSFCADLEEKGYFPLNLDQVGLLLEKKKAEYFEKLKTRTGSKTKTGKEKAPKKKTAKVAKA
jgi:hypothetical protein